MKSKLLYFLYYTLFWLAFFVIQKLIFLIYNWEITSNFLGNWPAVFVHGFKLDLSTTGYVLILPVLLLTISSIIQGRWYLRLINIYSYVLIIILSIGIVSDLVLYSEWGFRLDATPLMYLKNPEEAAASTTWYQFLMYIVFIIGLSGLTILVYRKIFTVNKVSDKRQYIGIPVFLLIAGSLIIPIRGGFGTAPINLGTVYFHKEAVLNHAAINLPWNVLYSITKYNEMANPFKSNTKYETIITNYSNTGSTSEKILKSDRPNIILVVLESFTSNVVGCLNDSVKATPYLDSIAKKGLLFSNFYASGSRSDKGIAAILSGYPALTTTSVMIYPNKTQQLPGLANSLSTNGYETSFYYGGDINFASMKSFIINTGFEKIISQDDFNADEKIMSWGVADEFLFNRVAKDIENSKKPYFKALFTLSSHPPFDVPGKKWIEKTDFESMFLNSVFYTDYHLGNFVEKLENKGLLENTLLILVADHGSGNPGNHPYNSKEKYHIPMIWYGESLTKKGVSDVISSQTDISKTLLNQLNINSDKYIFGRDIFGDKYKSEVLYSFRNGFGYLNDSVNYYYFQEAEKFVTNYGMPSMEEKEFGSDLYYALYKHFLSLK